MRYKVVEGSHTGHCCFEFTVVDTTRPEIIGGKPYVRNGEPAFQQLCECFERKDADVICDALNVAALNETWPDERN